MKYYVVDAFTEHMFRGNPAGVCIVDKPLDVLTMQNIAAENNLSETAFITAKGDGFDLRWFTPEGEIDLCGHATLASGFVISNYINKNMNAVKFNTLSGMLEVTKRGDLFEMDFPIRKPQPIQPTSLMEQAIGCPVSAACQSRDCLLLVENENAVQTLTPNMELLRQIPDSFAVIVTAKGDSVDFVSRVFAPNAGILEDPVTGSSHSTLIPFWSERLQKSKMVAKQLSKRGGMLFCEDCSDRVKISGKAVLYLSGEINY